MYPDNTEILFSALGTKGDIYPLIGLASNLMRRGHKVVFMTNDYFKPTIESHRIEFYSLGSKDSYMYHHCDKSLWDPKTDFFELAFSDYMKPAIRASYDYVKDRYAMHDNLLVISLSSLTSGAFMAAQALNIPAVLISLSPAYIPSRTYIHAPLSWFIPNSAPQFIKTAVFAFSKWRLSKAISKKDYFIELNQIRNEYGLPPVSASSFSPVSCSDNAFRIGFFPEWYGHRPSDWPDDLHLVGFPLFDEINNAARETVDNFILHNGQPVLFTAGTGVFDTETLFTEGQKICNELNVSGLFVGGGEQAADFITSPNCIHVGYVDFEHVLPQCLAIVHHGGIGTLAQAVRSAIPQLIRPLTFDQPENGCRVQRMGLGTYILPKLFKAKYVVPMLKALIDGRHDNHQLHAYSADIKRNNAIGQACDLIEGYLDGRAVKHSSSTHFDDKATDIPLIRETRKGESEFCCIAMLALSQGVSVNVKNLCKQAPKSSGTRSLNDIKAILENLGINSRALQCPLQHLSELRLPCLIYFDVSRFVVLAGMNESGMLVNDPTSEKQSYTHKEFQRRYSGIALELAEH